MVSWFVWSSTRVDHLLGFSSGRCCLSGICWGSMFAILSCICRCSTPSVLVEPRTMLDTFRCLRRLTRVGILLVSAIKFCVHVHTVHVLCLVFSAFVLSRESTQESCFVSSRLSSLSGGSTRIEILKLGLWSIELLVVIWCREYCLMLSLCIYYVFGKVLVNRLQYSLIGGTAFA